MAQPLSVTLSYGLISCSIVAVVLGTKVCSNKHTPVCPAKNKIRADWLSSLGDRSLDILTISHGIFDVLSILGWSGRIQACDIDMTVRLIVRYLGGLSGRPSKYPHLNILPPGKDILAAVVEYCEEFGVLNLGAVDVDLACKVKPAANILAPVLMELIKHQYRGKVFLTFLYGRGEKCERSKSLRQDVRWLKRRLPSRAVLTDQRTYKSNWISDSIEIKRGSNMCILEFTLR